ncbi:hypothetical protein H1D24_34215 [Streptomyces sp. PSKA28]|uniref:Oligopeptide/dipeptide ABC transporter C-terminal domain-containing protein n=1 Tax=Streptomyces himalayensis subsp. himalayensis TaxID=2756131 RepID=A0A7W0ID03_9ACTN|nr:hypothetical protein [Streptomyces himalayensis subsp. himalayensis]
MQRRRHGRHDRQARRRAEARADAHDAHRQGPGHQGGLAAGATPRRLKPIPGRPPSLGDAFTGCPFAARCPDAESACDTWSPEPVALADGGTAACRRIPAAVPATAERNTA